MPIDLDPIDLDPIDLDPIDLDDELRFGAKEIAGTLSRRERGW